MKPKIQKIVDLVNEYGVEIIAERMGIEIEELLDVLSNFDAIQYVDFERYQHFEQNKIQDEIWTYLLKNENTQKNAIETIANSFSDISFDGKDYFYEVRDKENMADFFSDGFGGELSPYNIAIKILSDDYYEESDFNLSYDLIEDVYDVLSVENKKYLRNRVVEMYGDELIGVPAENVTDVIEEIATKDENGDYEFKITHKNVMDLFSDDETMIFLFDNYLDNVASGLHSMYYDVYNETYYAGLRNKVWEELHNNFIDSDNKYGEEFYNHKRKYPKLKVTKTLPELMKKYFWDGYYCDSIFNFGSYEYFINGGFDCNAWEKLSFVTDYIDNTSLKQNINLSLKRYI